MPELNMISPLLTNMELVKCVSVRSGTSVYIVKSTKSNQSYYLKHICIPESQKQVDALMFTGAAATAAIRSSRRRMASASRFICWPNTARHFPRCLPKRP